MAIGISLVLACLFLGTKRSSNSKKYIIWSLLLVLYLSTLLSQIVGFTSLSQLTFMSSQSTALLQPQIISIPFSQGFDISSFLNILVFIPLGIALTVMWDAFQKALPTFFVGMLFSITIEFGQLFTLYRQTDINDVIMNTFGVMIGWLLAKYLLKWNALSHANRDWIIFFTLSFLSVFLFG